MNVYEKMMNFLDAKINEEKIFIMGQDGAGKRTLCKIVNEEHDEIQTIISNGKSVTFDVGSSTSDFEPTPEKK